MLGVRVLIDGILLAILIFTFVSVRATAVLIAVDSRRVCDVRPCDGFFPSGLLLMGPRRIRLSFSPLRLASRLALVVCSLLDPVSSLFFWLPNSGCAGRCGSRLSFFLILPCQLVLACVPSHCVLHVCLFFVHTPSSESGNLHSIRSTFGAVSSGLHSCTFKSQFITCVSFSDRNLAVFCPFVA